MNYSPARAEAREGRSNDAVPLQGAVVMPEQPPNGPTLKARHLTRSFGQGDTKTTALNDASLDLHGGQIALLMGPSGSGKSTLLAVLSGLLRPDAGEVLALGQDIWAMSDKEQERFRLK